MDDKENSFVKNVILMNAVGDIVVGIMLTFFFEMMTKMMDFLFTEQSWFLAGGWGMGAISYAILRFYIFNKPQYYDLIVKFGLAEGGLLFLYCMIMWIITTLNFAQIAVSLFFALFFTLLYISAFKKLKEK